MDYCNAIYFHYKNIYDIKLKIKRIEHICLNQFSKLENEKDLQMQKVKFIIKLFINLNKIIDGAESNAGELNLLIIDKTQ